MFCPDCGKQMPDKSKFCMECGTKLEEFLPGEEKTKPKAPEKISLSKGDVGVDKSETTIDAQDKSARVEGGIHVRVGGESEGTITRFGEHCPICGFVVKDSYFECRECRKNFICSKHYDEQYRICEECALKHKDKEPEVEEKRSCIREKERKQEEKEPEAGIKTVYQVLGAQIECPHCEEPFYNEKTGSIKCPECDEEFTVDSSYQVLGAQIECPHCEEPFYNEKTGSIKCPQCYEKFTVDSSYQVLGAQIECPHCEEPFYNEKTGSIECPECYEKFTVNSSCQVTRT